MAFIGHRCGCGHTDLEHTESGPGGICQADGGVCRRGCTPDPESQVIPTFDLNGHRIERVITPGEGHRTESGAVLVRTCSCDACTALHEQLLPAAA